jgi:hypothetical protein
MGPKVLFPRGAMLPGLMLSPRERSLARSAHFLPVLWSSLAAASATPLAAIGVTSNDISGSALRFTGKPTTDGRE